MVVGVDDVSAIVSLAAICLTLCQGCFKGFVTLSRAQTSDRRITNLALRIELEQLKLFLWAEQAGLLTEPPQLRVSHHFRHLVPDILKQLEGLLSDAQVLKFKYGITIHETLDVLTDLECGETNLTKSGSQQLPVLQRLRNSTLHLVRASPNPWRRVKWVVSDEQHFRQLLDDILSLTDQLQSVLGKDVVEIGYQVDTVLRSAIIGASNPRELAALSKVSQEYCLSALAAPAKLRKQSILSGLFGRKRVHQISNSSLELELAVKAPPPYSSTRIGHDTLTIRGPRKLSSALLDLPDLRHCYRQLAYYNDRPTLVEWRDSSTTDWKRLESRIARFSALLGDMSEHNSFHCLPCLGFVKHPRTGQYGYVFDVSPTAIRGATLPHTQQSIPRRRLFLPTVRNLRDVLNLPSLQPSLNLRVSYAVTMLETVLQLHTAGWLHKEIRSDNVLYVGSNIAAADQELLQSPTFIAGYTYAREDEHNDFTESLALDPEADLYRHPSTVLGACRQPYRMSFDVFSIGCVLLEIGLWKSLSQILLNYAHSSAVVAEPQPTTVAFHSNFSSAPPATPPATPKSSQLDHSLEISRAEYPRLRRELLAQFNLGKHVSGDVVGLLAARTGETYMSVVKECFNIASQGDDVFVDEQSGSPGEDSENARVLEFEERALRKLRALAEAL